MKNIYIIIALFCSTNLSAQIVTIPDPNFKDTLVNDPVADFDGDGFVDGDVDTNNDGEIQVSEAESVIGLYVNHQLVSSLDGIQSFMNISYLKCDFNNLTELDLTQNTNLVTIECHRNDLITLNLPPSSALENLKCSDNDLSTLDVSQNPNLKLIVGSDNKLTALNTNANPLLEALDINDNFFTSLDVTQNPNLTFFDFSTNFVTNLDLSNNPNIEFLDASVNNFNTLDVSAVTNLDYLKCWENNIFTLDVSQNVNLTRLQCWDNNLHNLNVNNNNNTLLVDFRTSDNPNLVCIQVDDVAYANQQITEGIWSKDETATYAKFCVLGTNSYEPIDIVLYPNPSNGRITINSNFDFEKVTVYSFSGAFIMETFSDQIDISDLTTGMYLVKLVVGGKNYWKKFLKN